MPNDGKGHGSREGSGPDPNPDPVPEPDPTGGPEEKAGPHHVICVPPAVGEEKVSVTPASAAAADKGCLSRSDSCHEECRICQQPTEEALIVLGCKCRGELAKAHRSCIEVWFRTKGSNKCEICQQVAVNVSPPESQPSTNYWVWRVDSAGGTNIGRGNHQCFSPLWVAFAILIGGLLLDVLISISLGVSALPVNIIIGVLIVLGLGTAFRLALECCRAWGPRRNVHLRSVVADTNHGSHPAL
ncbi:uncharacterized protein M6B38_183825 [Iris pallida]|uniref:RING-CH-type domain-containing protein n=1 Tax=Iris pallida TaxID=29817 RepID=A0AAX6EL51_IRIPA|nr:uncharacterized protein M6B38_183825 [Iris pallida]